jgi:hypothetical protein
MCKNCGCEESSMKIQYQCNCKDKDCTCHSIIGFDTEPKAVPHCCGAPMKRKK